MQEGTKDTMVWKVLLVIAVILVIVLVALYYFGRKLEKRQAEGQTQKDSAAQTVRNGFR